jgi:hypothetical protein
MFPIAGNRNCRQLTVGQRRGLLCAQDLCGPGRRITSALAPCSKLPLGRTQTGVEVEQAGMLPRCKLSRSVRSAAGQVPREPRRPTRYRVVAAGAAAAH